MEKHSGHLNSSAAHRAVQPSTMLDRRYVKRPATTSAGRYSSTARPNRPKSAAPSRLVNLNVHATDLEVAKISEAIRHEVTPTEPDAQPEMPSTSEPEEDLEPMLSSMLDPEIPENGNMTDHFDNSDYSNFSYTDNQPAVEEEVASPIPESFDTEPVSMYTLEAMKQSMMQDLVNQHTAITAPEPTPEPTMPEPLPASTSDSYTDSTSFAPTLTQNNPDPAASESIDLISKATSDALASIRIATESSDVSEQMASLKAFADSIKSDSPEMSELSNTIEKFANVAMKSSKAKEEAENQVAMSVNRSPQITQTSSRINRAPTTNRHATLQTPLSTTRRTVSRSPQTAATSHVSPKSINTARRTPSCALSPKTTTSKKRSTSTKQDQSLEKALRSVASMNELKSSTKNRDRKIRRKSSFGRFALALGCATACIAIAIYFVGSNIPDISVRVAALQTGIEASYPTYIPQDYSLSDISSEEERIVMRFKGPNKSTFTIVEERSSWDSSALQRNYVETTWGENYTTTHEQGITIFISDSDAAWVNGGILYKITSSDNNLTKKQLRNIVTSM